MKKSIFIILTLPVIFFSACESTVEGNDRYTAIDSPIVVSVDTFMSRSGAILSCQTEKIYPCFNFTIRYSLLAKYDQFLRIVSINIELIDIFIPAICLTALGPAASKINLGGLPDGSYQLNFRVNKSITQAKLIVKGDSLNLIGEDSEWIKFK